MPDVVSSIVISYVPIFILGCLLDLIASGVWVWRHAYAGILHQGGLSGPIVFWGIVPAIVANFHKFNWTYVTNAKKQVGGGTPPTFRASSQRHFRPRP